MARWWEDDEGVDRLARDRQIVAEGHPALHHEVQADGGMAVVGDYIFTTDTGQQYRIPTRITFPDRYPTKEPLAFETGKRFPHEMDRHFYPDTGRCCLWLPVESDWQPGDPEALRTFLDQLGIFYLRQVMLDAGVTDVWPGPQRGHGAQGYVDALVEQWGMREDQVRRMRRALTGKIGRNAPCPCGSRVRFRRCHQGFITRFIQRTERDHLVDYVMALEPRQRVHTSV